MTPPNKKQIEKAKEYLRKRLSAENSMKDNLEKAMTRAAEKIVDISCKYNIPPSQFRFSADTRLQKEVDEVIRWLKERVEDLAFTLAVSGHTDEREEIIDYINRENHGKTFRQRNSIYTGRYKYELEAAVAAGIFLGKGAEEIIRNITASFSRPYSNPHIVEAMQQKGNVATRLRTGGISYGIGHSNSMYTSLKNISVFAVAEGWSRYSLIDARRNGAKGFYTFRGSSYPCNTCNAYASHMHPLSAPLPPLHLNCVCGAVFIF